jgi:hypothetical protein
MQTSVAPMLLPEPPHLFFQINNGVFLKINSASINMLRLVSPYVTFGTPNLKTVRELIYKRGFGSINKQRVPLTDNKLIEEQLGKHGIVCMEVRCHPWKHLCSGCHVAAQCSQNVACQHAHGTFFSA